MWHKKQWVGYEIDRIKPSADVLCRIADFLNVSTDYLLGRVDEIQSCSDNSISEDEYKLLIAYRLLNEKNKDDLLWYANALLTKEK